jgi:uncharacterized protein YjbI with pentapeptide repeats
MHNAELIIAILEDANLHGAILTGANLTGANLRGANLARTIMREVNIHSNGFEDVKSLENAVMPDGTKYEEWLQRKTEES